MPTIFAALDVLAALGSLALAGFFAWSWARSRDDLHLLLAAGFALLAVSYPAVAVSHFAPGETIGRWDAARLAGQSAGALGLALAYAGRRARSGAARKAGWVVALGGVAGLVAALLLSPPTQAVDRRTALVAAHALQAAAFFACAAASTDGWRRRAVATRALVPAGFAALGASKLAWLLVDVGFPDGLVVAIYAGRFAGLVLLLLALGLPMRAPRPRAQGGVA